MAERAQGMLMVIMEPNGLHDEEFNDWYDLEHVPQLSAVSGVLAASRWICVDGWPRYLATYDLEHVDVLKSDSYRKATGANFTPWTRRMLGRVRGWRRIALGGLDLSAGAFDSSATALDVLFSQNADSARQVAELAAKQPGVVQARPFEQPDEGFGVTFVEAGGLSAPTPELGDLTARLGSSARYVRYHRGEPFAAFHAIDAGAVH